MSPVQANTRMSDRRGTRAMSLRIRLPPSEGRVEKPRDAEDLVDLPGAAVDGDDEQVTGDPGRAGLAAAPHGQGLEALLGRYARRDDAASRRTRSVNRSS